MFVTKKTVPQVELVQIAGIKAFIMSRLQQKGRSVQCPAERGAALMPCGMFPDCRLAGLPRLYLRRHGVVQVFDRPKRVDDPGLHRWDGPQPSAFVLTHAPAEIEVGDVQRHGRGKVRQLLRERVGQPRESFAEQSDRSVVPFNV